MRSSTALTYGRATCWPLAACTIMGAGTEAGVVIVKVDEDQEPRSLDVDGGGGGGRKQSGA